MSRTVRNVKASLIKSQQIKKMVLSPLQALTPFMLLAGVLTSTSSNAAPIVVPAAIYTASVAGNPLTLTGPGSITGTSCGSFGCETSNASVSSGLSATANGTSSFFGGGGAEAIAGGSVTYFVGVEDSLNRPDMTVPLHISGNASATASGAMADAEAHVDFGLFFTACSSTQVGACPNNSRGGSFNTAFSVASGTVLSVQVGASGSADGGSFSAFADPIITIDPTFLASNPGFFLVYSQNIDTLAPVPEPSTWVIMAAGFSAMLGLRRKQLRSRDRNGAASH